LKAQVSAHYDDSSTDDRRIIQVDVRGDDLTALIGRHAETLTAFQHVASLIVGKQTQQWVQLIVDVEGYRSRREKQIRQLANRMADQVTKTGRKVTMEPMPSSERRVVHIELRGHPAVTTESTGEEPYRKVVILAERINYLTKQWTIDRGRKSAVFFVFIVNGLSFIVYCPPSARYNSLHVGTCIHSTRGLSCDRSRGCGFDSCRQNTRRDGLVRGVDGTGDGTCGWVSLLRRERMRLCICSMGFRFLTSQPKPARYSRTSKRRTDANRPASSRRADFI
jgi:hypothetical protein